MKQTLIDTGVFAVPTTNHNSDIMSDSDNQFISQWHRVAEDTDHTWLRQCTQALNAQKAQKIIDMNTNVPHVSAVMDKTPRNNEKPGEPALTTGSKSRKRKQFAPTVTLERLALPSNSLDAIAEHLISL